MQRIKQIIIVILVILLGLVVYFAIQVTRGRTTAKYTFGTSSETVIEQIHALNKLETASYTIEKVIDAGTDGNKFEEFLFGDRLLLIAHGTVIAGFDLSEVSDDDIEINNRTLTIALPPPQILHASLDNDQTRVFDREQGILTKGDTNLESSARVEAEKVIIEAACAGGILNEASKNARNQLSVLFKSFDYTTVIITIPPASC